ncbi:hypothetical protein CDHC01_0071 [Corynebacterium diphtheriae HC01]|nr:MULTISPECIES: hypothetical protein [Corynebacterium]AEX73324.1 hypothetical protein CDHC01_0071 [Corynebacterium diphtheriae HC01]MBG9311432.1 hypothetical protein [Corynebacterium belfantii]OLN14642.1 hypothetical protein BUE64_11860 [Corynebacterium diphtheriae subsp. lausannense]
MTGESKAALAQEFGVTRPTVYRTLKTPKAAWCIRNLICENMWCALTYMETKFSYMLGWSQVFVWNRHKGGD